MFAVIEIGGRQYKVAEKQQIEVEKLEGDAGKSLKFNKILLLADENGKVEAKIGQPYLAGASVEAKIIDQFRGEKVIVHKFIAKKRHSKTHGHRQNYTRLEITGIKG